MPGFSTAWALFGLERREGPGTLSPRTPRSSAALNLQIKGRA